MKIIVGLSVLLLLFMQANAQTLQQKLQAAFNRLELDEQCKYASLSLTVADVKTNETIFTAHPDLGLAPASALKTITAITAFNLLGTDFQYQTLLGYTGTITDDGTLNGDLIIKGDGDPTLGSWRWAATKEQAILTVWVDAIRKAGIEAVQGRIIGDDALFGTQAIPDGWLWQDVGNYYGGGATGLSWRENQFQMKIKPGKVGTSVLMLYPVPKMPYLTFKSELLTGPAGSGDLGFAYLPVFNNVMYLRGTYAIDQTKGNIALALPDPAYDVAFRLNDTLKRIGLLVKGGIASSSTLIAGDTAMPLISKTLYTIKSPRLSQIVYWLNQKSINLYAENLLKSMSVGAGKQVSTTEGVKMLQNFWKNKGVDVNTLNIFDGSGLSPRDRITTLTLTKILISSRKEKWFNDFYESLPLYNDMKMKSGSGNDILSYAGFHTDKSGREVAFSIIVNNYSGSTAAIKQKLFIVLNALK
ncbi:MAG: D-alanyl-D-alanine carboxypeptidase/D-alanyl-D-alanine endopeptidase [Sphingobacteriaceae bacterium]